jgi:amidase
VLGILNFFCGLMLDAKPWLVEPPLLEMPWNRDVPNGKGLPPKLSIAILWDDGVVAPHGPIVSTLERYREALIAVGHGVIDWEPLQGWDLAVGRISQLILTPLNIDDRSSQRTQER